MTEIIAEIGINAGRNGKVDIALAHDMIVQVKKAGADVAKFHVYDPVTLLNQEDYSPEDWLQILSSKLSKQQLGEIKSICDHYDIEFFASAFDFERLGWLEEIGVKRHKIASRSIYDVEYVKAVQDTGKDYLWSTGWLKEDNPLGESRLGTYQRLHMNPWDSQTATKMYCISEYPTPLEKISVYKLDTHEGFSDHTVGNTASMVAIALQGVKVVEKHYTYDKTATGPDHKGSADYEDLKTLCKFRDEVAKMGE